MYNEIMVKPEPYRETNVKKPVNVIKAGLLAMAMVSGAVAAPRIMIDSSSFNFGYVPQNSAVSHIFWLKSTGDDTLKIIKVTPG